MTLIGMALVSGLIGVAGLAWLWSSQQDAPQSVAQGTTAPAPVQAPAVAPEPEEVETEAEAQEEVDEAEAQEELDEANPDELPGTEVDAVVPEPVAVASLPETRPVVSKKPDPVRTVTNPEPVPQEPASAEPTLGTLVVNRAGLTAADQFFLANARGQIIKDGDPVPGGTWKIQYRRDNDVQLLDSPIIKLVEGQGVSLTCSAVPRCRHSVK